MPKGKKTGLTKGERKELEERIRNAALQIIEKQGHVIHSDIPKMIDYVVEVEIENEKQNKNFITDASARSILSSNFKSWNLVRDNIYKKRYKARHSLLAYAKSFENIPYLSKERTAEEIEEMRLKKEKLKESMDDDEWMDDFVKKKGPSRFVDIKIAYGKYYDIKVNGDKALGLIDIFNERIEKGIYIHDGKGFVSYKGKPI